MLGSLNETLLNVKKSFLLAESHSGTKFWNSCHPQEWENSKSGFLGDLLTNRVVTK